MLNRRNDFRFGLYLTPRILDGASCRALRQFVRHEVGSGKVMFPPLAHPPVPLGVGRMAY
jgi:hypothetical protein